MVAPFRLCGTSPGAQVQPFPALPPPGAALLRGSGAATHRQWIARLLFYFVSIKKKVIYTLWERDLPPQWESQLLPRHCFRGTSVTAVMPLASQFPSPRIPSLTQCPLPLSFGGAQAGPASHPWAKGMAVPWAGSSAPLCAAPHPAATRENSRALPVGLELLIPSLSACHLELLGALLRPSPFPE